MMPCAKYAVKAVMTLSWYQRVGDFALALCIPKFRERKRVQSSSRLQLGAHEFLSHEKRQYTFTIGQTSCP